MSETQIIFRKKTILLIDDNEHSCHGLKLLFETSGATVYTSSNLEKATVLLTGMAQSQKLPDLVIMDVRLPHCYGLQALKDIYPFLKAKDCPVVIASHGLNSVAVSQLPFYGVVGYVRKPVLTHKLFEFTAHLYLMKCKHEKEQAKVFSEIAAA